MKETTAKEKFDEAYDALLEATAAYQSIIQEQTNYVERISEARNVLLEKKKALKLLSLDVTRKASISLSGRPRGTKIVKTPKVKPDGPAKKRGRPRKVAQ